MKYATGGRKDIERLNNHIHIRRGEIESNYTATKWANIIEAEDGECVIPILPKDVEQLDMSGITLHDRVPEKFAQEEDDMTD